jgi:hypothetical protein
MTELVYELLDAHRDTIVLADERLDDMEWDAHLAYLRDLQRVAREALARACGITARASGLLKEA